MKTKPLPPRVKKRVQQLEDFFRLLLDGCVNLDGVAAELLLGEYVNNNTHWREKLAIAEFVVRQCRHTPKAFIIDTGSTAAAFAAVMMSGNSWPPTVVTNSITTAAFINMTKSLHRGTVPVTYVPGGRVHSEYLGTAEDLPSNVLLELMTKQMEQLVPDDSDGRHVVAVVAASFFSATAGPGANSEWNASWKRFACSIADQIFVCFDASKMDRDTATGVHTPDQWMTLLRSKQVNIVIAGEPKRDKQQVFASQVDIIRTHEKLLGKPLLYHGTHDDGHWSFQGPDPESRTTLSW